MTAHLDDFIDNFGSPGRYQVFVYLLLSSNIFPVAFNHLIMVFYGITPPHTCKLPEGWHGSKNESIPQIKENGHMQQDSCNLYKSSENWTEGTMPCPNGWDYTPAHKEWTIVSEWNLVCEDDDLISLAATLYFAGVTIGGPIIGPLADKFGRRPVLLGSLYGHLILALGVSFAQSYTAFVCLRFVLGIFMQGVYTLSVTIAVELFHSRYRTIAGVGMELIWPLAMCYITLVAYKVGYWRHIQLILCIPSIVTLTYFWLQPESLRWLISHQNINGAQKVVEKYIRFNKLDPHPQLRSEVEDVANKVFCNSGRDQVSSYNFRDLFYSRKMSLISCMNFLWWFTAVFAYYGLAYTIPTLGGNFYLSFLIGASIEFCGTLLMLYILGRFGRKIPLITCNLLAGVFCLAVGLITILTKENDNTLETLKVSFAVIGKAFTNACFNCLPVYGCELFPTVIRSIGMGMSGFWARFAGMVVPQVILLGQKAWHPLPFLIFSTMTIACGLLTLLLPETLGKAMPETLNDVDSLWETPKDNTSIVSAAAGDVIAKDVNGTIFMMPHSTLKRDKDHQYGTDGY